jgi:type VI secretion system secreted protein VgrG
MAFLQEKKFEFRSQALPEDTFGVVRFRGTEGLSRCYEFEIDLVSDNPEIDMTAVLENQATFTILREDGDIPFHGILAQFEQLHEIDR